MEYDLRSKIIEVATELFMSQGFSATSTRQISNLLDITQPAIYHHFRNKEHLYSEVIDHFAANVGLSLNAILSKKQSSEETLTNMALYLKENHAMNIMLMMHDLEYSLSKELEEEMYRIWRLNYFLPFVNFFESIKSDLLPTISVTTASLHFLRILSVYITETYHNDAIPVVDIEDMVLIFLRGVTAH